MSIYYYYRNNQIVNAWVSALHDVAIIAIFVAVGMPIELYGDYWKYTFLKRYKTFIDTVKIGRRWQF